MAHPVIATKFYVLSRRDGLTRRPRLIRELGRGAEASLTLISAPPGFGKTTLLAEWFGEASDAGARIAWLSLDRADNRPVAFWSCVASAHQEGRPLMPHSPDRPAPTTYQIRVAGHLDQHWSAWLGGLPLTHEDDGTTTLAGVLPDQPALHGVLTTIRDLNLTLVALARLDRPAGDQHVDGTTTPQAAG